MLSPAIVGFVGAGAAVGIVIWGAILDRRSAAQRAFLLGMVTLGCESLFAAFSAGAVSPDRALYWQNLALGSRALLPGIWLFFSLTFGRGNYQEFLTRWRLFLILSVVAPLTLVVLFRNSLIVDVRFTTEVHRIFRMGWSGMALHLFSLMASIFILMNLERTFRAAVGTMRWRIKYMILGLGVLFAARAYTNTQCLLFGAFSSSLQAANSAALIVACLLIARWLFRAGRSDVVAVYPSHAVLHHSLTILLAGIYLLVVGVFAKVVTFLGGDDAFPLKAFVVLVALVLLSLLLLSDRVRLYTGRFVSRHFQRPLYNYRTVWRSFTEAMASRVQQADLFPAAVKLVSEVFEVLSVTIWLVDEKEGRFTFGAPTA